MGLLGSILGGVVGGIPGAIIGGAVGGGGGKSKAPRRKTYDQLATSTFETQKKLAPGMLKAEKEYRPQYAELDFGIVQDLFGGGDAYRTGAAGLQEAENLAGRLAAQGNVGIQDQFGMGGTQALLGSNPFLASLLGSTYDELSYGRGLSPQHQRQLSQDFRATRAAQGLGYSPQDAALEAFTIGQAGEQMLGRRQQNAMFANQQFSPLLQQLLFGDRVRTNDVTQGYGLMSTFLPGDVFNPESAAAFSLEQSNQNAAANLAASKANNRSGLLSALIGGGAALGGAGIEAGLFDDFFG